MAEPSSGIEARCLCLPVIALSIAGVAAHHIYKRREREVTMRPVALPEAVGSLRERVCKIHQPPPGGLALCDCLALQQEKKSDDSNSGSD